MQTINPTRTASQMRDTPFSLFCKTFYSAWKEHLSAPPDCPISPRAARRIQLFCARIAVRL